MEFYCGTSRPEAGPAGRRQLSGPRGVSGTGSESEGGDRPGAGTLPLLDPVQPDRTTPRTGSKNPPSGGGRTARKIKLKHKSGSKTCGRRRRRRQICLPVLTLWGERTQNRAESAKCASEPGPGPLQLGVMVRPPGSLGCHGFRPLLPLTRVKVRLWLRFTCN